MPIRTFRSIHEINKYRIHAIDGEIGNVGDFIVDIEGWVIRYIIVDTKNWLPGKKVIIFAPMGQGYKLGGFHGYGVYDEGCDRGQSRVRPFHPDQYGI